MQLHIFLSKPLPATSPCIHFCRDLVTKADFLRLYYSFTTLRRTYKSKPHTITFSIKNSSWLSNWQCVASSCCCWEKFGLSWAGFCVFKVLCWVCVASFRDLPILVKSRFVQDFYPGKACHGQNSHC